MGQSASLGTSSLTGAVEELYQEYLDLSEDLGNRSPSSLSALNRSYHKHLLVAAASSLEQQVKTIIPQIFERHGREFIGEFVAKAVLARGYHLLFDWKNGTAASFFANFGPECRRHFKAKLESDDELRNQHDAFMTLGARRNDVVHNDYATYLIELTPHEVIIKYRLGHAFIQRIEDLILDSVSAFED